MTKEEYNELVLDMDIESLRLSCRKCDLDSRFSDLEIEKEMLEKEGASLEKRRLALEIRYKQARKNGELGYEDPEDPDEEDT